MQGHGILTVRDLNTGTIIKQGDQTTLKFQLMDYNQESLNIQGKTCEVVLLTTDFKSKVTIANTTVGENGIVSFSITANLLPTKYYMEFVVDGKYIFPSEHRHFWRITPSSKGVEITMIDMYGKDALVNEIIDKLTSGGSVKPYDDTDIRNLIALKADKVHSHDEYATKDDLAKVSAGSEVDLSGYIKKTDADRSYQAKGEYAKADHVHTGYLQKETFTQTEADLLYQPKGEYLKTIPPEYVTEEELQAKDYATKSDLANVSVGSGGTTLWEGTQDDYDEILEKDPKTWYFIRANDTPAEPLITWETITETQPIPITEALDIENPDLEKGIRSLLNAGEEGELTITYERELSDSSPTGNTRNRQEIVTTPMVQRQYQIGTKVGGEPVERVNLIQPEQIKDNKQIITYSLGLEANAGRDTAEYILVEPNKTYTFDPGFTNNGLTIRMIQYADDYTMLTPESEKVPNVPIPYTFTTYPETKFVSFSVANESNGRTDGRTWIIYEVI